jgi:CMP-N,N'-diacetyllegionaminic acid synthase
MKFVGIIPARGGSKGIPKKNIKKLCGKPLIAYTIEEALKSRIDRVIVSTDDDEIAEISRAFGAEVIMRPYHLAEDKTPTQPVLLDVIEQLGESYDYVLTLQPTSPLRKAHHINEGIEAISKDSDADSLVSIVEVPHNCSPSSIMQLEGQYIYPVEKDNIILRRQDKQTFWARNGAALYITRSEKLKDFIWGGNTIPYPMSKLESLDIDDMEDWLIVESILKNNSI